MSYICKRCGYYTEYKGNLKNHFNRKRPCKPIKSNISFETLKKEFINLPVDYCETTADYCKTTADYCKTPADYCKTPADYCKTTADYCKTTADYCKTTADYCENTNLDEISINSSKDSVEINIDHKNNLICQYCNKTFSRKENLENHLKKSCKMLKDFNNIYKYDDKTFGKNIYKNSENAGDIYIIQTDYINEDHYKIGITKNIKKRMGNYRCGNTYEPRLHYYIACKDIKLIDNKIKIDLVNYCVKREIFKGDVVDIKNKIVEVIKKEFKIDEVHVHEPDIKIGDLSECGYCNKCFYTKNDLFDHLNSCENYKEYLSKKKEGKYECKFCGKNYSKNYNLHRHYKSCKKKDIDDKCKIDLYKQIQEMQQKTEEQEKRIQQIKEEHAIEKEALRKEIEKLLEKVGNNNNNKCYNIKNQTIMINSFGKENMDYITSELLQKLLKGPYSAVPKLIKNIHFHPKHPENHNVKITNKKLPYASVWDKNKWLIKDKRDVIESMVDKSFNLLDEQLEDNPEGIESDKKITFSGIQDKYVENDRDTHKMLQKEAELILLNGNITMEDQAP